MRTRIIHTKIWEDEFFAELNPIQKLVFIYYIANDNIGLTGVYEITNKQVCFDTGVSKLQLQEIKQVFQQAGKILFYQNWVKIPNAQKLNNYTGKKLEKAVSKELDYIPLEVKTSFDTLSIDYLNVKVSVDTSINHKSKIINHKSEIKGVVKGEKRLEELDDGDFEQIANKYHVPIAFVRSKYDDLVNWHGKNPQKNHYQNYYRALMDWVKRDAINIVEGRAKNVREAVDATHL